MINIFIWGMEKLALTALSTKVEAGCPPETLNAYLVIFIVDSQYVSLLCLLLAENESKKVADCTYIAVQSCLLSKLCDCANSRNFVMLRILREVRDKMISIKDIARIVRLCIFAQSCNSNNVYPPKEYRAKLYIIA